MVLDRADSTEAAVELIGGYAMLASSGRDYHFFITDASGDSRVVEYDCDSSERTMTVTRVEATTNFYAMHADRVLPHQRNGRYGHGRERYDSVMDAAAQDPNPQDITSNTQWSIVYSNTDLAAEASIRLHWEDRFGCDLRTGDVTKL